VAISLAQQKKAMEKRGHQVTVLCPRHPKQKPEAGVIRLPSLITSFDLDYPLPWPLPLCYVKSFLAKKYDLVYFHHPFYTGNLALKLARFFNCPKIFFYHSQ